MKRVLIRLVRFYQVVVSRPLHWLGGPGAGCRFTPTCSQFFLEAVQIHGAGRGTWLGIKRLVRCHPWGGHGWDPVPPRKEIQHIGNHEWTRMNTNKPEPGDEMEQKGTKVSKAQ